MAQTREANDVGKHDCDLDQNVKIEMGLLRTKIGMIMGVTDSVFL